MVLFGGAGCARRAKTREGPTLAAKMPVIARERAPCGEVRCSVLTASRIAPSAPCSARDDQPHSARCRLAHRHADGSGRDLHVPRRGPDGQSGFERGRRQKLIAMRGGFPDGTAQSVRVFRAKLRAVVRRLSGVRRVSLSSPEMWAWTAIGWVHYSRGNESRRASSLARTKLEICPWFL